MIEPFTILLIVFILTIFILYFTTWPVLNYILQFLPQPIPQPVSKPVYQPVIKPQESPQNGYYQYLVQKLQTEISSSGGISNWISTQNPSSSLYQPFFYEVWTTQHPYVCLYSSYYPSRINQSAEQLTKDEPGCMGDPTCDVMTLINELVYAAETNQGCFTPINQTWSFPRSVMRRQEKSLVFKSTTGTISGRDVIVRILFNPKPSPAFFRTNWQDTLPNKKI